MNGRESQGRDRDKIVSLLEANLDPFLFRWLQLCAALPVMRFPLTIFLGLRLTSGMGRIPPTSQEIVGMCNLPWARQGWIPDDLREGLLVTQSAEDKAISAKALLDLTYTASICGVGANTSICTAPPGWEEKWSKRHRSDFVEEDLLFRNIINSYKPNT